MNPIEAAKIKANQPPRPLTDEQQAIVDERDAITARKLKGLERQFAKVDRKVPESVKLAVAERAKHGRNGWAR